MTGPCFYRHSYVNSVRHREIVIFSTLSSLDTSKNAVLNFVHFLQRNDSTEIIKQILGSEFLIRFRNPDLFCVDNLYLFTLGRANLEIFRFFFVFKALVALFFRCFEQKNTFCCFNLF